MSAKRRRRAFDCTSCLVPRGLAIATRAARSRVIQAVLGRLYTTIWSSAILSRAGSWRSRHIARAGPRPSACAACGVAVFCGSRLGSSTSTTIQAYHGGGRTCQLLCQLIVRRQWKLAKI
ncbi:hypothetical protein BOTBODRAFT_203529 [Botryobasidium botryosum FD-172 SS1]|uniref:Uncharacterized protein n=1 Tax=Botryobasidium botryosum (strain FD-172 SS1) TaxID=930990 RepID=A0A067N0R8_BOTB1|nr:hypothetical protein BOTBODRAFT_203529 [Botryobasidium botryosum FD-172 SS1]